jgi:hypothetical protein
LVGIGGVSVITDMARGMVSDCGIETIRIVQKYIPTARIMVFVKRKKETMELMESRDLKLS